MPDYERDGRNGSDASPLLDSFSRQSSLTSPINAPLTSSPSTSGTYKQFALIFLALCVVGYLFIVFLEISPLVYSHRVLSRLYSASDSSHDCHVHTHTSVDDPFTVDERIDHLLYRSLKLAIDRGDDTQAANVARELAVAAKAKALLPAPTETVKQGGAGGGSVAQSHATTSKGKGKRKFPPTTEEVDAVKAQLDSVTVAEVKKKSEEQWATVYSAQQRFEGYIHRTKTHLADGHELRAEGCNDMDGQCSAPGPAAAAALCNKIDACRGFACNTERSDCQLRVAPLVHDTSRPSFDAYYKTATDLATADVRISVKRELELSLMAPGTLAPADFDFNAACSASFKCVIAYGLYGDNPKYVEGAMENVKLQPSVFPGWVARIYHDHTVPQAMLQQLQEAGAELVRVDTANNEKMKGSIAGMFWRFLVAEDDSVQRYIVRDSDSRLNPREAAAVKEWMESGYSVHTMRDHPNHDRGLNGGMWGGVRGAVKGVRRMIQESSLNGYGADLSFLGDKVWPAVLYDQLGHDAYTCEKYLNSRSFPTQRPDNFQHVGQVFENGQPRQSDITGWMDGEVPMLCRRKPAWKYG